MMTFTLFQINTNSLTAYVVKLFMHIEVELHCFKQIQIVSLRTRSNCLCMLELNSPCFKQIQTVWPRTVHIEVKLSLFQTNTNSFTAHTVKLFVHIEAELMWYWQINCWLAVSNRKQQWKFILMVRKSLVALFSPGASCSTSPQYHALHPLHSQSFSSAIGLLDAVQHLCSCTVQYLHSVFC